MAAPGQPGAGERARLHRRGAGQGRPRTGSTTLQPTPAGLSVGTDHDTAAFAVATIARWWQAVGQPAYPARDPAADLRRRRRVQRLPAPGSGRPRSPPSPPAPAWPSPSATSRPAPAVGSGAGAVASPVVRSGSHFSPAFACGPLHCRDHGQGCPVSSPRRLEPCMRFSRTRLTDAVHRQHSASPASPGRAWVRRRSRQGRSVPDGSVTRTTPPIVRTHASVCVSWRQTAPSASA